MDPAAAVMEQMMSRMDAVREAEERGDSEIQRLFNGSVVFITGGTGFLGKQLVEKLLRACHDIKKIYLLTRSKKGKTMEERLNKTFQDPVFDQLRKIDPEFEKRIAPVEGDIKEIKLGIRNEDWKTLTQEVNFIYHVAATVLFNEPIKSAIMCNVRGTREAITLARECHNLKSMVYVSTAYSHCNRNEVLEKFYPSPVSPTTIIEMVENMEESRLDAMTPALVGSWPNTYTFSKAIAEETVWETGAGLPICIVRPAIVVPTQREPVPGWLDRSNVLGPSGIVLGGAMGLVRTLLSDYNTNLDVVPVDYVNNLTIAASWETATKYECGDRDIRIYTCSRFRNRLSMGEIRSNLESVALTLSSPKTLWYQFSMVTTNKHLFLFWTTMLHFIPSAIFDAILMAMGKKFRFNKIYCQAYKLNIVLSYFLLSTMDLHDSNTVYLHGKLSKSDQLIFNFDIKDLDHRTFMTIWWLGLRKYIVKDGLVGSEIATKRQHIFRIANYIVMFLYCFSLWKVFCLIFWFVTYCFSCILLVVNFYY